MQAKLCALLFSFQMASGEVILYPAPGNLPRSDQYEVQVFEGGVWKDSYVYIDRARTDGNGARDLPGRTFSWTTLETTAPVKVRVTRKEGPCGDAVIRPLRHDITTAKVDEKTIEFELKPGQKVSVEFDTELRENCFTGPPYGISCIVDSMAIFADAKRQNSAIANVPDDQIHSVEPGNHHSPVPVTELGVTSGACTLGEVDGKTTVVFKAGVHDVGYWQVAQNITQIHLEPGAIVYGAIDVIPTGHEPYDMDYDKVYRHAWEKETLRPQFKLTGPGVLSGARLPWHLKKNFTYSKNDDWWEHVKLVQLAVKEITVEDIVLVNSPYWVLSFINDTDRRSQGVFDNFKMLGAWTYNNDGLPIGSHSIVKNAFIHAADDAFKLYNNGGRIDHCVVWQSNNGAVFQFGWFPKSVRDVEVNQVDVIHFENWYGVNQSNRAVFNFADAQGKGLIEDIRFNNITVERRALRLFGFKSGGGQQFRNFTFTNLKTAGMGVGQLGAPGRNYFIADAKDFSFVNFTFGDQVVSRAEQAQFDFAEGAGDAFTFSETAARKSMAPAK
jgi:hypothetical protein